MKTEYIIVAGCGRLGVHLANQLSGQGHSVVVVDVNDAKFRNLSAEFSGFRVEGNAAEVALLEQAKVNKADKLIAVTRDDNVNLAIAQIARTVFNVPIVVARVNDPQREAIFRELGVHTVCPMLLANDELLRWFAAGAAGENAADNTVAGKTVAGKTVADDARGGHTAGDDEAAADGEVRR